MTYLESVRGTATKLREKGHSYKEISNKLNITKSTAYVWLKHVKLDYKAKERIHKLIVSGRKKGNSTKHLRKLNNIEKSRLWARKIIKSINFTEPQSQIYCSLLYWAEGAKFTDNRLEFTNSDPAMITTFLKLLRNGFKIDEDKLRANIHIHEYHNDLKQRNFWSKITKIPIRKFTKSYLKPHTQKVVRINYQGCVRICYYSSKVAHKIRALYTEFSKV